MTAIPKPFSRRGTGESATAASAADGDAFGVLPFVPRFRRRQSFLFLLGDGVVAVGFFLSELGVFTFAFSVSLALAGVSLLGVFSSELLLLDFSFSLTFFLGDLSGTSTCQFFWKLSSSLEFVS